MLLPIIILIPRWWRLLRPSTLGIWWGRRRWAGNDPHYPDCLFVGRSALLDPPLPRVAPLRGSVWAGSKSKRHCKSIGCDRRKPTMNNHLSRAEWRAILEGWRHLKMVRCVHAYLRGNAVRVVRPHRRRCIFECVILPPARSYRGKGGSSTELIFSASFLVVKGF